MDKFAQRRGLLNKLHEGLNVPLQSAQNFFNPELKEVMKNLRLADDNIRTILTGDKIGNADVAIEDPRGIKEILKSARSNFNRNEFMAGVADLGIFHKKLFDVSRFINKLTLSVDKIHHHFLFKNLDQKQQSNIKNLQEHMGRLASTEITYFVKEAGVMDFFHNIGTRRGRALAMWIKKYPKVAKNLRDGGSRLLDVGDNVLANVLSLLKEMAGARASGNVDSYMEAAKNIDKEYNKFDGGDKGFRAYYQTTVMPFLTQQAEMEAQENKVNPIANNNPLAYKDEVSNPVSSPIPLVNKKEETDNSPQTLPSAELPAAQDQLDQNSPDKEKGAPIQQETTEQRFKQQLLQQKAPAPTGVEPIRSDLTVGEMEEKYQRERGKNANHTRFYHLLETMANESPLVLTKFIKKYAKMIERTDYETSLKLMKVAALIKG